MAVEKSRLLLLFHTLAVAHEAVRATDMAVIAGVSERTIKNDMAELRSFAKASGAEIQSRKGEGYFLRVNDEELFLPVKEQLQIRFNNMNYSKTEIESRINDIIRRLIVAKDYIKFDDIAESLYLSRRTLQEELREVRALLSAFHLSLHVKPKYGVLVEGNEFDKRLCMLEFYEVHYHRAISLLNYDEYAQYFDCDEQERNDIRHTLLAALRKSDIALPDSYTQRIARYLILMRNRRLKDFKITIDLKKIQLLKSLPEYKVACDVMHDLMVYPQFVEDENEICALETLFASWNDLVYTPTLPQAYPHYYPKALDLSHWLANQIEQRWNVNFMDIEDYQQEMTPCLIPLLIQKDCDFYYQVIGPHVESNGIRTSPVSLALAKLTAQLLEDRLELTITDMDVNMLAIRFYLLLSKVSYPYKPRNLLICSRNGKLASQIIRNQILSRFKPRYFKAIDIYEFYEVRDLDQSQYDYLLLNFPSYAYRYELPFLCINQIPNHKEMNDIFNQIIMGGYPLHDLLDAFKFDHCQFYPDFQYRSKEEFIHLLSFKNGKDYQSIQLMQKQLDHFNDFRIVNHVAILIQDRMWTKQNSFEIYQLHKPSCWEKKEIRSLLYITTDLPFGLQSLRFLDQVTHQLSVEPSKIEELLETESLEKLVDFAKLSIQAG